MLKNQPRQTGDDKSAGTGARYIDLTEQEASAYSLHLLRQFVDASSSAINPLSRIVHSEIVIVPSQWTSIDPDLAKKADGVAKKFLSQFLWKIDADNNPFVVIPDEFIAGKGEHSILVKLNHNDDELGPLMIKITGRRKAHVKSGSTICYGEQVFGEPYYAASTTNALSHHAPHMLHTAFHLQSSVIVEGSHGTSKPFSFAVVPDLSHNGENTVCEFHTDEIFLHEPDRLKAESIKRMAELVVHSTFQKLCADPEIKMSINYHLKNVTHDRLEEFRKMFFLIRSKINGNTCLIVGDLDHFMLYRNEAPLHHSRSVMPTSSISPEAISAHLEF